MAASLRAHTIKAILTIYILPASCQLRGNSVPDAQSSAEDSELQEENTFHTAWLAEQRSRASSTSPKDGSSYGANGPEGVSLANYSETSPVEDVSQSEDLDAQEENKFHAAWLAEQRSTATTSSDAAEHSSPSLETSKHEPAVNQVKTSELANQHSETLQKDIGQGSIENASQSEDADVQEEKNFHAAWLAEQRSAATAPSEAAERTSPSQNVSQSEDADAQEEKNFHAAWLAEQRSAASASSEAVEQTSPSQNVNQSEDADAQEEKNFHAAWLAEQRSAATAYSDASKQDSLSQVDASILEPAVNRAEGGELAKLELEALEESSGQGSARHVSQSEDADAQEETNFHAAWLAEQRSAATAPSEAVERTSTSKNVSQSEDADAQEEKNFHAAWLAEQRSAATASSEAVERTSPSQNVNQSEDADAQEENNFHAAWLAEQRSAATASSDGAKQDSLSQADTSIHEPAVNQIQGGELAKLELEALEEGSGQGSAENVGQSEDVDAQEEKNFHAAWLAEQRSTATAPSEAVEPTSPSQDVSQSEDAESQKENNFHAAWLAEQKVVSTASSDVAKPNSLPQAATSQHETAVNQMKTGDLESEALAKGNAQGSGKAMPAPTNSKTLVENEDAKRRAAKLREQRAANHLTASVSHTNGSLQTQTAAPTSSWRTLMRLLVLLAILFSFAGLIRNKFESICQFVEDRQSHARLKAKQEVFEGFVGRPRGAQQHASLMKSVLDAVGSLGGGAYENCAGMVRNFEGKQAKPKVKVEQEHVELSNAPCFPRRHTSAGESVRSGLSRRGAVQTTSSWDIGV